MAEAMEAVQVQGSVELVADPEVDMQVATARRYPRSVTTFMRKATEMATLTPEIAASCIYALPRKEDGRTKNIEGPSARLAEICASAWGNIRAEGKVLTHDAEFVTARGTAWDVEANVAIAYEVRRRITDSKGRTYSADMIGVTGNAGASIALRNALLKVIPTPFWKPIYNACRKVIAGDQKTFSSRRDAMLHEFAITGVTEERLLAALGLKGRADITGDHMVQLAGFLTALRDGETTIEEAFPEAGGMGGPQPGQRRSQQQQNQPTNQSQQGQPSTGTPATTAAATTTSAPGGTGATSDASTVAPNIGTIAELLERANGWIVRLTTGYTAGTQSPEVADSIRRLKDAGRRVELITKPSSNPRSVPIITEVEPLEDDGGRA